MTREELEDLAREMLAEARMETKDLVRAKMRASRTCKKRAFLKEEAEEMKKYFKRYGYGIYDCRNCEFWHLTTHTAEPLRGKVNGNPKRKHNAR